MLKKAFTMRTVTSMSDAVTYYVVRNYKNGKSKVIGKPYKTHDGAMGYVRHRNACYYDKHGTEFVRGKMS
jgi:hypothetical protein